MATWFYKYIWQKFWMLTVTGISHMKPHSQCMLNYICDCGTIWITDWSRLVNWRTISCWCIIHTKALNRVSQYILKKFWMLTIVWYSHHTNSRVYVKCICECGNKKIISLPWLINWKTISCWCYKDKIHMQRITTHGMYYTKFYKVFDSIKQRCNNPKQKYYRLYWWKWIKCMWESFEDFKKDMFESYKEWLSIDRIDWNWNYCKENCRWIELVKQQRNKCNTVYITINWEKKSLPDWVDIIWLPRYKVKKLNWKIYPI